MAELPLLDGQIRVLVIEDDIMAVHSLLARCTEAGMDTRYAPYGAAALEAVHLIRPHLIVLGITEPDNAGLTLAKRIVQDTAAPILVLGEAHTDLMRWQEISTDPARFMLRDAPAQQILERITACLRAAYHEQQLMVSDTPSDTTVGLPVGWGKCQSCGYIGPRAKFVDANPLARHSLICPACRKSNDIVFSVS